MSATEGGCGCSCNGAALKVIFSCSGCADVGELADQSARKLTRDGAGKMACLAGISGKVSGIVKSAEAAQSILAIDGCPLDCTRKTLGVRQGEPPSVKRSWFREGKDGDFPGINCRGHQ